MVLAVGLGCAGPGWVDSSVVRPSCGRRGGTCSGVWWGCKRAARPPLSPRDRAAAEAATPAPTPQVRALCCPAPGRGCGVPASYLSSQQGAAEAVAVKRELRKMAPTCKVGRTLLLPKAGGEHPWAGALLLPTAGGEHPWAAAGLAPPTRGATPQDAPPQHTTLARRLSRAGHLPNYRPWHDYYQHPPPPNNPRRPPNAQPPPPSGSCCT